jgi:hypothetical protein
MKGYQNIEQLKKEWANYGVRINEKGELVASHEGKEYKIGQASFFTENEPISKKKKKKHKK